MHIYVDFIYNFPCSGHYGKHVNLEDSRMQFDAKWKFYSADKYDYFSSYIEVCLSRK